MLGTAITWTAPAFLRLDEGQCLPDDCDITGISEEEASWIASIYNLAAAAAGPISGFLMSRYGRKFVIMWYAIPMVVGYGAYIVADLINDNILIHVGRVLTGITLPQRSCDVFFLEKNIFRICIGVLCSHICCVYSRGV